MKVMISLVNLRKIFFLVILPLLITIVLFTIFTIIFKAKNKKERPEYTIYVINYWSNILGIIFAAIITGLATGFCIAFNATLRKYGLVETNKIIYYALFLFPLIPFSILILFVSKLLQTIKYRDTHELDKKEGINYGE